MATARKRGRVTIAPQEPVEDLKFWQSELGKYIEIEADEGISIESVRQALAAIPGSMADVIRAEREES